MSTAAWSVRRFRRTVFVDAMDAQEYYQSVRRLWWSVLAADAGTVAVEPRQEEEP